MIAALSRGFLFLGLLPECIELQSVPGCSVLVENSLEV